MGCLLQVRVGACPREFDNQPDTSAQPSRWALPGWVLASPANSRSCIYWEPEQGAVCGCSNNLVQILFLSKDQEQVLKSLRFPSRRYSTEELGSFLKQTVLSWETSLFPRVQNKSLSEKEKTPNCLLRNEGVWEAKG